MFSDTVRKGTNVHEIKNVMMESIEYLMRNRRSKFISMWWNLPFTHDVNLMKAIKMRIVGERLIDEGDGGKVGKLSIVGNRASTALRRKVRRWSRNKEERHLDGNVMSIPCKWLTITQELLSRDQILFCNVTKQRGLKKRTTSPRLASGEVEQILLTQLSLQSIWKKEDAERESQTVVMIL